MMELWTSWCQAGSEWCSAMAVVVLGCCFLRRVQLSSGLALCSSSKLLSLVVDAVVQYCIDLK